MRDNLRVMATETMAIIEAGRYRSAHGRDIEIAADVRSAVAETRLHLPVEKNAALVPPAPRTPVFEVTNETSLSAARRLGPDVGCGLADAGRWFDHVVFAVLDHQRGAPTYTAFASAASQRAER